MNRLPFILLLALVGCSRPTSSPPASPAPATSFTIVHPTKRTIPKFIDQPGTIRAFEEAPIFAKLAGFVRKVNVDIGDAVDGTVLAELSIPELEDESRQKLALVEQAKAEVEQAKKQVAIAESNVSSADAMIVESRAGLERATATFDRWESESKRVAEMVRTKVVDPIVGDETRNQFRGAEAGRREAQARVTVAEKSALKARAELGKSEEDVKAYAARRQVAEAEAARLVTLLDYRNIRAPFAGVVTKRGIDTGHFVHPAGTVRAEPLFTVVRLDTVRVPVDVPEADAGLVHKGQKAVVKVPAMNAEFTGTVSRTSEALDPASRTLRVEIDLPNANKKLRPGMFVTAKITAEMPEAWVLPATAVVKQADQTVVFLHVEGKAVRLTVQPGRTDGTWTEVFRKQKAAAWEDWVGGERVLNGATGTLADGMPVAVRE